MSSEVMYEVDLNLKGTVFVDATSKEEVERKIRELLYDDNKKELVYKIVNSIKYDYKIEDVKEIF